ncbi:hypothetical protein Bca4012_007344 [Brassica carinata]
MLHAIRNSNGKATLCSRYVKTYKYNVEKQAGAQVIPNVFSGFNGVTASVARGALTAFRVLAGQYNPVNGNGLANTSLAFFCNRLFALGESDLPYAVRLTDTGDIETIGRFDFDGKLEMSMTAHPKTDPQTGDTFAFRYSPVPPFLTFFRFDSTGKKQRDVPVYSLTSPSFVHDFAITKRHAIFAEIQIVMRMNIMDLVLEGGSPVGADNRKTPRLGVIPRYAGDDSEMKWFEVPGFNIIHAINAWDDRFDRSERYVHRAYVREDGSRSRLGGEGEDRSRHRYRDTSSDLREEPRFRGDQSGVSRETEPLRVRGNRRSDAEDLRSGESRRE